jgi:hypothetical protein
MSETMYVDDATNLGKIKDIAKKILSDDYMRTMPEVDSRWPGRTQGFAVLVADRVFSLSIVSQELIEKVVKPVLENTIVSRVMQGLHYQEYVGNDQQHKFLHSALVGAFNVAQANVRKSISPDASPEYMTALYHELQRLYVQGLMHDASFGFGLIPKSVLKNSESKLPDAVWEKVKKHPQHSLRLVRELGLEDQFGDQTAIAFHHEFSPDVDRRYPNLYALGLSINQLQREDATRLTISDNISVNAEELIFGVKRPYVKNKPKTLDQIPAFITRYLDTSFPLIEQSIESVVPIVVGAKPIVVERETEIHMTSPIGLLAAACNLFGPNLLRNGRK